MSLFATIRSTPLPVPSAAVVAASLVGGYAAARASGVRALGGAVLLAGGAAAAHHWNSKGPAVLIGLSGLYLGAFGLSHPLAKKIGAWPAVLTAAGVAGGVTWAVADRD